MYSHQWKHQAVAEGAIFCYLLYAAHLEKYILIFCRGYMGRLRIYASFTGNVKSLLHISWAHNIFNGYL